MAMDPPGGRDERGRQAERLRREEAYYHFINELSEEEYRLMRDGNLLGTPGEITAEELRQRLHGAKERVASHPQAEQQGLHTAQSGDLDGAGGEGEERAAGGRRGVVGAGPTEPAADSSNGDSLLEWLNTFRRTGNATRSGQSGNQTWRAVSRTNPSSGEFRFSLEININHEQPEPGEHSDASDAAELPPSAPPSTPTSTTTTTSIRTASYFPGPRPSAYAGPYPPPPIRRRVQTRRTWSRATSPPPGAFSSPPLVSPAAAVQRRDGPPPPPLPPPPPPPPVAFPSPCPQSMPLRPQSTATPPPDCPPVAPQAAGTGVREPRGARTRSPSHRSRSPLHAIPATSGSAAHGLEPRAAAAGSVSMETGPLSNAPTTTSTSIRAASYFPSHTSRIRRKVETRPRWSRAASPPLGGPALSPALVPPPAGPSPQGVPLQLQSLNAALEHGRDQVAASLDCPRVSPPAVAEGQEPRGSRTRTRGRLHRAARSSRRSRSPLHPAPAPPPPPPPAGISAAQSGAAGSVSTETGPAAEAGEQEGEAPAAAGVPGARRHPTIMLDLQVRRIRPGENRDRDSIASRTRSRTRVAENTVTFESDSGGFRRTISRSERAGIRTYVSTIRIPLRRISETGLGEPNSTALRSILRQIMTGFGELSSLMETEADSETAAATGHLDDSAAAGPATAAYGLHGNESAGGGVQGGVAGRERAPGNEDELGAQARLGVGAARASSRDTNNLVENGTLPILRLAHFFLLNEEEDEEHPRGLAKEQIDDLATRTYGQASAEGEAGRACSICISEYAQGNKLRRLPCAHEFHIHCIDRWLSENNTCPICRQPILAARHD